MEQRPYTVIICAGAVFFAVLYKLVLGLLNNVLANSTETVRRNVCVRYVI